jgi:hypothetical protein
VLPERLPAKGRDSENQFNWLAPTRDNEPMRAQSHPSFAEQHTWFFTSLVFVLLSAGMQATVQSDETSVVLLVHGAESAGDPQYKDLYSYAAFRNWAGPRL